MHDIEFVNIGRCVITLGKSKVPLDLHNDSTVCNIIIRSKRPHGDSLKLLHNLLLQVHLVALDVALPRLNGLLVAKPDLLGDLPNEPEVV